MKSFSFVGTARAKDSKPDEVETIILINASLPSSIASFKRFDPSNRALHLNGALFLSHGTTHAVTQLDYLDYLPLPSLSSTIVLDPRNAANGVERGVRLRHSRSSPGGI